MLTRVRPKSPVHAVETSESGFKDLHESFDDLNANLEEPEVEKLVFRKTKTTLRELQEMIAALQLPETGANRLLESVGYPKIGAYLAFAYLADIDPDIFPAHDLQDLLCLSMHAYLLEINPWRLRRKLLANRLPSLTDIQFERLKIFVVSKILPLVEGNRYPSIAETMVKDIILPYPAIDERNKELLALLISEVARLGSSPSGDLLSSEKVVNKDMTKERNEQGDSQAIEEAVGKAIQKLRANTRAVHPTKFEKLLDQFKQNEYEPVSMSTLGKAVFGDKGNAEREVQFKISRLNTKLSSLGLQIERKTTYTLKLAGKDSDSPKDK